VQSREKPGLSAAYEELAGANPERAGDHSITFYCETTGGNEANKPRMLSGGKQLETRKNRLLEKSSVLSKARLGGKKRRGERYRDDGQEGGSKNETS